MLNVLSNFLMDINITTGYDLFTESEKHQDCFMSRGMFDVIADKINENSFYCNSLTVDTADVKELVFTAMVDEQPAKLNCLIKLREMDTYIHIALLGFITYTKGGKIILTDSLKSKLYFSR